MNALDLTPGETRRRRAPVEDVLDAIDWVERELACGPARLHELL